MHTFADLRFYGHLLTKRLFAYSFAMLIPACSPAGGLNDASGGRYVPGTFTPAADVGPGTRDADNDEADGSRTEENIGLQPNGTTPALTPSAPQSPGATAQTLVSLAGALACLDLHDHPTEPAVNVWRCNGTNGQTWTLDDEGYMRYAGKKIGSTSEFCLTPDSMVGKNGGNILVQPCNFTATQQWKMSGTSLLHRETGLCLDLSGDFFRAADNLKLAQLKLAKCTVGSHNQMWYLGARSAARAKFELDDAARSLQDKCSPVFEFGFYVATDPGFKRFIQRYGSLAATLEVFKASMLSNCQQMYTKGDEVPVIDRVILNFWTADTATDVAGAAVMGAGAIHSVNFYSPYWATAGDAEQSFSGRTDSVIHHELTHILDWGFGRPSGITEGYANLIAFRTGYLPASQKRKGGNWTDGYSTSAFFLKWIDDTYMTRPRPQRFTDVMMAQGRKMQIEGRDENWFSPWLLSQTGGKSLDQLWQLYQASF